MAHPHTKATISRSQPSFALKAVALLHHQRTAHRTAPVAIIGSSTFTQHHNLPYQSLRVASPPPPRSGTEELLHDESVQVLDTDTSMLIYSTPEDGNASHT